MCICVLCIHMKLSWIVSVQTSGLTKTRWKTCETSVFFAGNWPQQVFVKNDCDQIKSILWFEPRISQNIYLQVALFLSVGTFETSSLPVHLGTIGGHMRHHSYSLPKKMNFPKFVHKQTHIHTYTKAKKNVLGQTGYKPKSPKITYATVSLYIFVLKCNFDNCIRTWGTRPNGNNKRDNHQVL